MTLTVNSTKYSIFGKYDFMEATPDNVSKLWNIFGKDEFLPNIVQMIQIEQPQNVVTKLMRPQFVNVGKGCNVTFLPDRIDIEMNDGKCIKLGVIIEYYDKIIKAFNLKINTIALNSSAIIHVSTLEESEVLRKGILCEKSYPYSENIIEWESRNVARKECDGLGELAKAGPNLQSIATATDTGISIAQIQIDTDINTLAEKSVERFDVLSCKTFFACATTWNKELLDNLERIV